MQNPDEILDLRGLLKTFQGGGKPTVTVTEPEAVGGTGTGSRAETAASDRMSAKEMREQ